MAKKEKDLSFTKNLQLVIDAAVPVAVALKVMNAGVVNASVEDDNGDPIFGVVVVEGKETTKKVMEAVSKISDKAQKSGKKRKASDV